MEADMKCVKCDNDARGICRFCGRAVCGEHMQTRASIQTVYVGSDNTPKVIAVKDAVYCGMCEPVPHPIEMPEIY
jgi:hypothetical protein